jgi:hypothetical protein
MSESTATRETPSSVEITRNAKGDAQFVVKLYAEVGDEEATAERAIALYERMTQWAKEQHA